MDKASMWSSQESVASSKNILHQNGRKKELLVVAMGLILFLASGILIGRYGIDHDLPSFYDIKPSLIDEISADNIGLNLRYLTTSPHVAGTAQDLLQAEWMRDRFLEAGLDEAKTIPYDVLLSYPQPGVMNTVSLIDDQGRINFTTAGRQLPLGSPEEFSEEILHNFNAFSASGVVEGNVVYVHYGRKKDYQYLLSRGINVSGSIALIRLGAIFRGSKVELAEKNGAVGVILFSDRLEKTSQNRNFTYPDSWWMPGSGAEYGHVGRLRGGDLLTPFYPAIESAFRIKEEDHPGLPKIPVQSIGYEEAEVILQNISPENSAPSKWVGKMEAPYNLGPNLRNRGWKVRLDISTNNQIRTTFNTIGILRGSVEDDRYVLLGNHRDAWTFGALDPSSGTASMIEIARAFGKLKTDKNWRPRRTIVFCSWGAKEYGLVGSYEWTQQHAKVLSQRAVAYLNVDTAVSGNRTLYGDAFPTLKQLLLDTAKLIPNPNAAEVQAGRETVYDTWLAQVPDRDTYDQPSVGNLGGGSDYEGFAYVIGVPSADFGYMANGFYPTYHSLYDSYHLASNIIDRGFLHHQAVARMWAAAAATLSDSVILPLDILAYGLYLNQSIVLLDARYGAILNQNNAPLKHVKASIDHFLAAVKQFQETVLKEVSLSDTMAVRKVNDKLMLLERFLIDPMGLPDHPETNHIIFSTSTSESHNFRTFAGLVDLIAKVENKNELDEPDTWAKIHHHLSVVAFLIGEAARSLVGDF